MTKNNHSGRVFEADCSRQIGWYKRMIFCLIVLYLHEVVTKVEELDAERNFLAGVYGYMRSEILWEFAREGIEADG